MRYRKVRRRGSKDVFVESKPCLLEEVFEITPRFAR